MLALENLGEFLTYLLDPSYLLERKIDLERITLVEDSTLFSYLNLVVLGSISIASSLTLSSFISRQHLLFFLLISLFVLGLAGRRAHLASLGDLEKVEFSP